jgi:ectoine hydroxylase-related dioxygenase (phytanoyl-CoA dioxygenase family)
MTLSNSQIDHFHHNGFFLIPNPFGQETMLEVERLQRKNQPVWESTEWPDGHNIGACQFLMMKEQALELVERPETLAIARELLGTEDIHVGACGMGDSSKTVSRDGRAKIQVQWHADGGPAVKQVSFRTALDRHDTSNGPLRVLPGTHLRSREEVSEELKQIEIATGTHDEDPEMCFAAHPAEVEVMLDPRWTLVWTPSCWHATGEKTAAGPRRAMAWNYYPAGGRTRDLESLKQIFNREWEEWSDDRKRLWGLYKYRG